MTGAEQSAGYRGGDAGEAGAGESCGSLVMPGVERPAAHAVATLARCPICSPQSALRKAGAGGAHSTATAMSVLLRLCSLWAFPPARIGTGHYGSIQFDLEGELFHNKDYFCNMGRSSEHSHTKLI